MHSADYAVAKCLSARPSHAGILSNTAEQIVNFFFTTW